jgi:PIN domain nuclease of toxin-antitoxin system
MKRLLLDIHILIFLLSDSKQINRHLLDDILYDDHVLVYTSVVCLQEIVILQHLRKIEMKISLRTILKEIAEKNIRILDVRPEHIETLEKLSYPVINGKIHEDPFDRLLIAQAISERITLVSSDQKFPFYKDRQFDLIQN